MADFKTINVIGGNDYVSIYDGTGLTPGTLVHITASHVSNQPPVLVSSENKPVGDVAGISIVQNERYDTESNDKNVWVRCASDATLIIQEIPA